MLVLGLPVGDLCQCFPVPPPATPNWIWRSLWLSQLGVLLNIPQDTGPFTTWTDSALNGLVPGKDPVLHVVLTCGPQAQTH